VPQEPLTHLSMTLPDEAVMRGMSAIDLISLRVRIRLMLRVSWLQNIWGASQRPENWNWVAFGQDFPEVESEWIKTHETAKSLTNVLVECEDVLSAKIGQYRTALTEGLKLNSEELDFLDFCVAIYREPA